MGAILSDSKKTKVVNKKITVNAKPCFVELKTFSPVKIELGGKTRKYKSKDGHYAYKSLKGKSTINLVFIESFYKIKICNYDKISLWDGTCQVESKEAIYVKSVNKTYYVNSNYNDFLAIANSCK